MDLIFTSTGGFRMFLSMGRISPAISRSGRCLPLALAWCALGFGAAANISWADGTGVPAVPPADSNPSSQTVAVTPVVKADKPMVLPKYDVNGLKERLMDRQQN